MVPGPLVLAAGALFAAAVYALLRGNLLRLVVGIILLTTAVNVVIFGASDPIRADPPLIPSGAALPPGPFASPLPQAMILTSIVIGFGFVVFMLVLVQRVYAATDTAEPDAMRAAVPVAAGNQGVDGEDGP